MQATGHRFIDHTADIALEAWAPSEETLLVQAARALVEVITEGGHIDAIESCDVEVESADDEDRLVRWLNEVLWLAMGKGFLLVDATITLRPGGLSARVSGQGDANDLVKTEVKSATYHDLHLAQEQSGRYLARVVLDV